MTDPYRAMCAELVDDLEMSDWPSKLKEAFRADIARARALLAQAVAEGVLPLKERPDFIAGYREGLADRRRIIECEEAERPAAQPVAEEPTDDEIEEWADACSEAPLEEMDPEVHGWRRCFTAKEFSETIRAALDRWGRPTPQPVAVSERLPGPEDCDELETCWQWEPDINGHHPLGLWERVHRDWVSNPDSDTTHWLPADSLPTPRPPMNDLSPAAQAVLDAICSGKSATDRYNILYRWVASAALQAVVDQVVPEEEEPVPNIDSVVEMQVWALVSQRQRTRSRLLAIAAELEDNEL